MWLYKVLSRDEIGRCYRLGRHGTLSVLASTAFGFGLRGNLESSFSSFFAFALNQFNIVLVIISASTSFSMLMSSLCSFSKVELGITTVIVTQ